MPEIVVAGADCTDFAGADTYGLKLGGESCWMGDSKKLGAGGGGRFLYTFVQTGCADCDRRDCEKCKLGEVVQWKCCSLFIDYGNHHFSRNTNVTIAKSATGIGLEFVKLSQ